MEPRPEHLRQRLGLLRDGLRRSGIKLTHQRLEIFLEVAKSVDHPDAETIYEGVRERVPTISLDTVYRTLWLLLDLGLITTLGSPRRTTRFDANVEPHHHFSCIRCGSTRDFHSEELDRLRVPEEVKALGSVTRVRAEVSGLCATCSERQQSE